MSSSGGQAQAVSAQHLLPRIQRGFKFALMNFKGPMALSHLGKKLSGLAVLRHEETWIALSPSRAFNAHQAPSIPLQSLMSWALTSIPFRNGMRPHPKQRSTTTYHNYSRLLSSPCRCASPRDAVAEPVSGGSPFRECPESSVAKSC